MLHLEYISVGNMVECEATSPLFGSSFSCNYKIGSIPRVMNTSYLINRWYVFIYELYT